jgi:energy-coupling factor transport system ATP-binding protein
MPAFVTVLVSRLIVILPFRVLAVPPVEAWKASASPLRPVYGNRSRMSMINLGRALTEVLDMNINDALKFCCGASAHSHHVRRVLALQTITRPTTEQRSHEGFPYLRNIGEFFVVFLSPNRERSTMEADIDQRIETRARRSEEGPPAFDLRSLHFQYGDGIPALKGIDLAIFPGDKVALVGQNGAGKTTLIKHLNGLYRPSQGKVFYQGEELSDDRLARTRLEIGILFQDPDDQLFCNTLDEDVAFGPRNQRLGREEVEGRVRQALNRLGLDQLRFKAPHHLSYGQKKRAAFATILAMNPKVLILDEPSANLDPQQERFFIEFLREFQGTLICISHDLPFLYEFCDRAVVLEDGKIHHDTTMQDLISHRDYLRDHGLDFTFRLSCCQGHGSEEGHERFHGSPHYNADPGHSQPGGPIEERPVILLEDYSYRYGDGTWGIRDVSLSMAEGDSVAVVGQNGAGKSTMVSCVAGIFEGHGRYAFDGSTVSGKNRKGLWRQIGITFQDPADQLFCPSCRDEIAFGPRQLGLPAAEVRARVEESLALVRLSGFEERVPHHLSAGERKRVALASVLAMRPRVIILDEPTANLDPQSELLLCEILHELPVTKILISHDIDIVALLCERTVVMHQGRIIRDYPTTRFMRDDHLISINGLDYTFKNACCREIRRLQRDSEKTGRQ